MAKEKQEEGLEDKLDSKESKDSKIYYPYAEEEDDIRKARGDEIVEENGSKYNGKPIETDAERQIRANESVEKAREEVYAARQKISEAIEKSNNKIDRINKEYERKKEESSEISDAKKYQPDSATDTLTRMKAAEEGTSPDKTREKAHAAYLAENADKVHKPNNKETVGNFFKDVYHKGAKVLDFSKYQQKKYSDQTYGSLKKGDKVVLYFGDKGHTDRRTAVEDSGKKYISVFDDGVSGSGPSYSPDMTEEEKAKAVYDWARKINDITGEKPIVAGQGKDGEVIEKAMNNYDLKLISKPYLIATETNPEYKTSGSVKMVLSGDSNRERQIDTRNKMYVVPNGTSNHFERKGGNVLSSTIRKDEEDKYKYSKAS